jgi:hypothetical protein
LATSRVCAHRPTLKTAESNPQCTTGIEVPADFVEVELAFDTAGRETLSFAKPG